jgi:hypothetical protein
MNYLNNKLDLSLVDESISASIPDSHIFTSILNSPIREGMSVESLVSVRNPEQLEMIKHFVDSDMSLWEFCNTFYKKYGRKNKDQLYNSLKEYISRLEPILKPHQIKKGAKQKEH